MRASSTWLLAVASLFTAPAVWPQVPQTVTFVPDTVIEVTNPALFVPITGTGTTH